MSAEIGRLLIATGTGLAVVSLAMLWAAKAQTKRRRPRAARQPVRWHAGRSRALTCTAVACGAITGGQWAMLSTTEPGAFWVIVLGLPAFLAGATLARLLAVLRIAHRRRRRVRAARRERGGGR